MKPKSILTYLIFALICVQGMSAGFLPVTNHRSAAYGGGPQNWVAVQDSIGRVYVGNRDGMLRYDGRRWRTFYLPNHSAVRSLMYDDRTARIYVGGSEEFGYFRSDSLRGSLTFVSIYDKFDRDTPRFSEIWNILSKDGKIYFQADEYLFIFDGKKVTSFNSPGRISRTAISNGLLYVALDDGRIFNFDGQNFTAAKGTEALHGRKIAAILPNKRRGTTYFVTSTDGIFHYDGSTASHFDSDIDNFLKENQVFCAAGNGDSYIFGTVKRGAVVINPLSGRTAYINKESGLQNNTVLNATFDRTGNIWLCLDNGLDHVLSNAPYSNLLGTSNSIGTGYASLLFDHTAYFGTNQGLYTSPYPIAVSPDPISLRHELGGQIWAITEAGTELFVAADAGAFVGTAGNFKQITGIGGCHMIRRLRSNPNLALAASYSQLHLLGCDGGTWRDLGPVTGYDGPIGKFTEDSSGHIWMTHWRKGLYRLTLDTANARITQCLIINESNGLPSNEDAGVSEFNGKITVSTRFGYYYFNPLTMAITKAEDINTKLTSANCGPVLTFANQLYAAVNNNNICLMRGHGPRSSTDTTSFRSLGDRLIPGFVNISLFAPDQMIVSTQDGFTIIDPTAGGIKARRPLPFVSSIRANHDTLVYEAPLRTTDAIMPEISYSLNHLRVEIGCADESNNAQMAFSTMLEGLDREWSPFTSEDTREYTGLTEGSYTLRIRAKDLCTGEIGETAFRFRVLPPWYRSKLAWVIYILLTLCAIGASVKAFTIWRMNLKRKIERQNEKRVEEMRLENERQTLQKDFEIATLKSQSLEEEIRHRSQELKGTTMNLVRKNEMLREIHEMVDNLQRLSEQHSDPQTINRHLNKIKTSINSNIRHDEDMKTINQNFDIVYEDFIKRLMELHPTLSAADKRMCCYVRMGLASKDVAPLVNISPKSVEMARYRLRKKMEVPQQTTLYDYLTKI